ncbi:MAG: cryptochrome/photolyase family protein [Oscillatoriales cyanobacterium RM2_1_1]|nr:cryptochrome/photolyase family protein [Oscillatoriales cyanobacterium SM2_3_0]NJO45923.1 cryptochrome/photolyase family protein [Oscillatoriales cyanobacterium RM2_1_1]
MTTGIWILGDQLSLNQAALQQADLNAAIPIVLIESLAHIQARPYHRQKLVLIWSAMRHFAQELQESGWSVTYIQAAANFIDPLKQWIQEHEITQLQVMKPSDRPLFQMIQDSDLPCEIQWIPNNHFLWSEADFCQWASNRKRLLMEDFYREGRKRFDILMAADEPLGGRWNFDKENRQPPKGKLNTPAALWFEPDEITQAVIQQVKELEISLYGQIEPFQWGVTGDQALQVLSHFSEHRLPTFGPYQDAMVTGEDTLWHGLLSPYLNLGLLQPLEVLERIELAHANRDLPLNSVEGFIRQVLGWREYMRGLYVFLDSDYPERNWFQHIQPLPDFFWDAQQTDMNCLHQTLNQVERSGYTHHIQRLMILANFALIAGLSPQEVENWFHAAFIDAYDWVMQTNVIGMGLFADGGVLASKPYAASANYINKMSDYCQSCPYDHRDRTGEKACPFNVFYWDFLDRHRGQLADLGRMGLVLSHLNKMSEEELKLIRQSAQKWRDRL